MYGKQIKEKPGKKKTNKTVCKQKAQIKNMARVLKISRILANVITQSLVK